MIIYLTINLCYPALDHANESSLHKNKYNYTFISNKFSKRIKKSNRLTNKVLLIVGYYYEYLFLKKNLQCNVWSK